MIVQTFRNTKKECQIFGLAVTSCIARLVDSHFIHAVLLRTHKSGWRKLLAVQTQARCFGIANFYSILNLPQKTFAGFQFHVLCQKS